MGERVGMGNCTGGARFGTLKLGEDFSGGDWRTGDWGSGESWEGKADFNSLRNKTKKVKNQGRRDG